MKYLLVIADECDGDYLTSFSKINNEDLRRILPIIEKIKNFTPYNSNLDGFKWKNIYNFPYGDMVRKDLGEKSAQECYNLSDDDMNFLMEFFPFGKHGIHTIKSIKIIHVEKEEVLL